MLWVTSCMYFSSIPVCLSTSGPSRHLRPIMDHNRRPLGPLFVAQPGRRLERVGREVSTQSGWFLADDNWNLPQDWAWVQAPAVVVINLVLDLSENNGWWSWWQWCRPHLCKIICLVEQRHNQHLTTYQPEISLRDWINLNKLKTKRCLRLALKAYSSFLLRFPRSVLLLDGGYY